MGNRTAVQRSLLPRVTFCMAVGAGIGEAAATVLGNESVRFGVAATVVALTVPFGILAWMAHRYRDRRVLKPLLFFAVLCLAAWGLSHLIDDALRFRYDPDHRKIQRLTPILVICGNWFAIAVTIWVERRLSRFSGRKKQPTGEPGA